MHIMMRWLIKLVKWSIAALFIVIVIILLINGYVIASSYRQTYTLDKLKQESNHIDDTVPILVLGAGIVDSTTPSNILEQRLQMAMEVATVLPNNPMIMSGDHMDIFYDEVTVMKNYVVERAIASERVYLDHAGYSTFDSLYRLKNVLQQDKVIIITQGYHLSRALMIARGLGIEAIGVPANEYPSTRFERELREIFARLKDFAVIYCGYPYTQPDLQYGFDLTEPGDLTNDKLDLLE